MFPKIFHVLAAAVFVACEAIQVHAGEKMKSDVVIHRGQGEEWIVAYPSAPLPVEKVAAEELAIYVKKATGVEAKAVSESNLKKSDAADAYIGATAHAKGLGLYPEKFEQESFVIKTHGGKLFIFGEDERGDPFNGSVRTGTLFGVYDFLEEHLGIAWIWPGPTGEYVPRQEGLQLPPIEKQSAPDFIIRSMIFGYMKYEPQEMRKAVGIWSKRMKLSWVPKAWFGHSWGEHVFKKKLDEKHPEWLAFWGGERRGPHLCTSNPALREHLVEAVIENAKQRGYQVVSISPSDGVGFCECERCRKLDPPGTDYSNPVPNLSNRHWDYANYIAREVKKRQPGLGVGMFAYTAYREPPTNIEKLEDNIFVSFTFSTAYFVKPEEKQKTYSQIERWKTKGVKIIGREYWGMHYWLDLPYLFTGVIAEAMPHLHACGLIAMYGETGKNFSTQGPNYFLVAHLMWDAEADSGRIMDRFYSAFGPAKEHIRSYYALLESCLLKNAHKIPGYGYRQLVNVWPDLFPADELKMAGAHLEEARKAAAGDPELAQRLKVVEVGYEYTVKMLELLDTYRKLGRAGVPLWFFGREGDLDQHRYHKLPGDALLPDAEEYWKAHPPVPLPSEEKLRLLRRAKELGEERERILKEYADLPAVSLGLYQYTVEQGLRPWHKAVLEELAKIEKKQPTPP